MRTVATLLVLAAFFPTVIKGAKNPDPDGDGIVTIKDCNATHLCVSDTQFYDCPAGYYSKQALVQVEEGATCTSYEQCVTFPELCGDECTAIIEAEEGSNTDDDSNEGGEVDPLAWCDDLSAFIKMFYEECVARDEAKVDEDATADDGENNEPPPSDTITDCNGKLIDEDFYGWLGDEYCDKNNQLDYNCAKFSYDCCDCRRANSECQAAKGSNEYCQMAAAGDRLRRLSASIPKEETSAFEKVLENVFEVDSRRRQLASTKKTTACHSCKKGTYCPVGTQEEEVVNCPQGFYCSTPSNKQECPENSYCTSTKAVPCLEGMYCPPLAKKGTECPPKYYCSEPQYKEPCPEGHFCRGGDVVPTKCSFYQTCPAKTSVPKGTVQWVLGCLATAFVLFEIVRWQWNEREKVKALERKKKMLDDASEKVVGDSQVFTALLNANSFKITHKPTSEDVESQASGGSGKGYQGFLHLNPDKTKISFEFNDLSLILNNGTRIIDRVTGRVRAGKMTAIMGPSGCGKTTMLNVLRDKAGYGVIGGRLTVNGEFDSIEPFKRIVGFVPQEDIMHSELSVEEAITFASLLKNKFSVSTKSRLAMAEEVIDVLGLTKCRHSVIGDQEIRGVSGGQRKRVSIALEIVGNPSICFLDEPTSGLDSTTSIELIATLKKMCDNGMTIVMVIHQPRYEIFNMIDDILFMGQNGRPVYLGASGDCLGYFNGIGFPCPQMKSPADHFLDVMSGSVQHATKSDFSTQDLSDWWEERNDNDPPPPAGSNRGTAVTAGGSNPLNRVPLGSLGKTVPPPVPYDALKKKQQLKKMEIERADAGEGRATAENDWKTRMKNWAAEKRGDAIVWIREKCVEWKVESVIALKSFKPGCVDKYRTPPSNIYQFFVCTWRTMRQIFALNKWSSFVSDCLMLLAIGAVLGWMFGAGNWKDEANKLSLRNFIASLALALTTCLRGLGTFGNERPVFWRERNSGLSSFSYFLGKNVADMIWVVVFPACFLILFSSVAQPRGDFWDYYVTFFWVAWAATGQGYLVSVICSPESAKFNGLLSVLLCVMFSGVEPPLSFFSGFSRKILSLSFARWSVESLMIIEFKNYPEIYRSQTDKIMGRGDWDMGNNQKCLEALFWLGVVFRAGSFFSLKLGNRAKG
jgi:ABC-type multidrug transport system ATPase subunit